MENFNHRFRTAMLLCTMVMVLSSIAAYSDVNLTDWHNVANKNHISRIIHNDRNLYVSSLGSGITVIEKNTGIQTALNRAGETSFDNSILDMTFYNDELWMTGKYYGLGQFSHSKMEKFDMISAGCFSTQWMRGIFVDNDNNILLGGMNAFYRFDGRQCIYQCTLNDLSPMVTVTDIKKTDSGVVYVSCYDAMRGNNLFQFDGNELIPISNPYRSINRMTVDGDILWLATRGDGLVKYSDGTFTQFNTSNSGNPCNYIEDITIDSGKIWYVGEDYTVCLDQDNFIKYQKPDNWNKDEFFTAVDADNGIIHVGSRYSGLFQLIDGVFKKVELTDDPTFNNITTHGCVDCSGSFLAVSSEGLNVYNPVDRHSDTIPIDNLQEISVSPYDGSVWLRLSNRDACIVRTGDKPISFSFADINIDIDNTSDIMGWDRNGHLWVATTDGIAHYDGSVWRTFNKNDSGFDMRHMTCFGFDSHNRLWCGTFGNGLIMYDGTDWHNYTSENSSLLSDYIGALALDNDDTVFMNCRNPEYPEKESAGYGLTSYDGNTWTTFSTGNSGISNNHIYHIAVDADNVKWLATAGDTGVTSFDGDKWKVFNVDNSGIAFNGVINIETDSSRGLIWFQHMLGNGISYATIDRDTHGIDEVLDNDMEILTPGHYLSVHTLQGSCIFSTPCYRGEDLRLIPGLYIISNGVTSKKVLIDKSCKLSSVFSN